VRNLKLDVRIPVPYQVANTVPIGRHWDSAGRLQHRSTPAHPPGLHTQPEPFRTGTPGKVLVLVCKSEPFRTGTPGKVLVLVCKSEPFRTGTPGNVFVLVCNSKIYFSITVPEVLEDTVPLQNHT
jgi:hypothetical protein